MPKLQKFKNDNKKITTKNMIVSLSIIMCLLIVVVITKSYAIYKMQKEFDVIKNQIGNYSMGDVRVAVLVDGKETDTFPSYETNYKVESIECSNGVTATFDTINWQINIADMSATSTKCTVSFNSKETNETTPVSYTKEELIALNEEIKNTSAKELADYLYPVGSIYMTTEDDTIEKVQDKFGGTWVKYSSGTTLVGDDGTNYITNDETKGNGGSSSVTLSESNLPSHSHVIPELSVSSWSGSHYHAESNRLWANYPGSSTGNRYITPGTMGNWFNSVDQGVGTLYTGSTTITVSGQKTTAFNTTTCTNCSATSFSVQNPYTVVYMYKRTA